MTAPADSHAAPSGPPGISIAREELNALPVRRYEGPVHLVHRDEDVDAACAALRDEPLLGFDIEMRPSFRVGESHPPALLQLATAREAFVIQLLRLQRVEPLLAVLSDPTVEKVGVALRDDLKKLRGAYHFQPAGFTDIAPMARERGYRQTGLRALCAMLFGFRLSKREQRSNWAATHLTRGQIVYAATDAWVSREIYLALKAKPVVVTDVLPFDGAAAGGDRAAAGDGAVQSLPA